MEIYWKRGERLSCLFGDSRRRLHRDVNRHCVPSLPSGLVHILRSSGVSLRLWCVETGQRLFGVPSPAPCPRACGYRHTNRKTPQVLLLHFERLDELVASLRRLFFSLGIRTQMSDRVGLAPLMHRVDLANDARICLSSRYRQISQF